MDLRAVAPGVVFAALMSACAGRPLPAGDVGGACLANELCNGNLVCLSAICVDGGGGEGEGEGETGEGEGEPVAGEGEGEIPTADWICPDASFGTGDCDCGCGDADPDCGNGGCVELGCREPSCALCNDDEASARAGIPSTCDVGEGEGEGEGDVGEGEGEP